MMERQGTACWCTRLERTPTCDTILGRDGVLYCTQCGGRVDVPALPKPTWEEIQSAYTGGESCFLRFDWPKKGELVLGHNGSIVTMGHDAPKWPRERRIIVHKKC